MTIEKNEWVVPFLEDDNYFISVNRSLDLLQHIFDTYELDKEDADRIEEHLNKFKSE